MFDWILKFWVPPHRRDSSRSQTRTRLKYRSRSPTERSSRVQPTLLKQNPRFVKTINRFTQADPSSEPLATAIDWFSANHSHGFEGSRIESFIRLTIGYSYKLLLRAPRWLNQREPPGPKAALLNRPGEPSQPPMKPSVTGLDAPNRPATHPPTQPDEPARSQSGYEARGPRPVGWVPEGFSAGRADSRLRACLLMKVRGGQRRRVCQKRTKTRPQTGLCVVRWEL